MSKEILIVGAGASGLIAGKLLAEKGYLVTIIESRDRIGGRIFSDSKTFSFPVEYGAEFIHGDLPFTMSLARESNSNVTVSGGKWYQMRQGKIEQSELFDDQWEEMLRVLNELKTDTNIEAFLQENFYDQKYADFRKGVKSFVEGYDAADTHKVSAFALREEWSESDDAKQYRIDGGYERILNFIADEIRKNGGGILLSSEVIKIGWSKGKVNISLKDGRAIRGERAIITVPIGVLQREAIEFAPALPHRKDLFHKIGNGGVIKFSFEFAEEFWESIVRTKYRDLGFILSDAVIPTWWTQSPINIPFLTGWWGGPSTFNAEHNTDKLFEMAVESLQYIFSCRRETVEQSIRQWKITDWVSDPNSAGAYAYATVHSENARRALSVPIEDTIYFAGEALYSGKAMGTVEAALVSGREVSKRISGLRGD